MRLSKQQIKSLQTLLHEQLGLMYTDEEAHIAGLAIMRFVLAKERKTANQADKKCKQRYKNNEQTG